MKPCTCDAPEFAKVNTAVMHDVSVAAARFLVENQGKLICYNCGGEGQNPDASYAWVTGGTIVSRLKEIGVL